MYMYVFPSSWSSFGDTCSCGFSNKPYLRLKQPTTSGTATIVTNACFPRCTLQATCTAKVLYYFTTGSLNFVTRALCSRVFKSHVPQFTRPTPWSVIVHVSEKRIREDWSLRDLMLRPRPLAAMGDCFRPPPTLLSSDTTKRTMYG